MIDILPVINEWVEKDTEFAIAKVIYTWGSAPRIIGSSMVISKDHEVHGSVSGGCVEGSVIKDNEHHVLGEEIQNRELTEKINLKYAVLGAEPWSEVIRKDIETRLQVHATNIFGLTEIIGPGVSQEDFEEKGTGSTIWEDHFYPEIIHPESEEVLPFGQDGILVFTTLTKEAMPLIRYKTNDICSLHYDSDSKRTHIKMSQIKGRSDSMLIIRGVNLYPTQIEEVLGTFQELSSHYHLVVSRESNLVTIEAQMELSENEFKKLGILSIKEIGKDYLQEIQSRIEKKLKDNVGLSVQANILEAGTVPRSEGGKLNRVTDNRTN